MQLHVGDGLAPLGAVFDRANLFPFVGGLLVDVLESFFARVGVKLLAPCVMLGTLRLVELAQGFAVGRLLPEHLLALSRLVAAHLGLLVLLAPVAFVHRRSRLNRERLAGGICIPAHALAWSLARAPCWLR